MKISMDSGGEEIRFRPTNSDGIVTIYIEDNTVSVGSYNSDNTSESIMTKKEFNEMINYLFTLLPLIEEQK